MMKIFQRSISNSALLQFCKQFITSHCPAFVTGRGVLIHQNEQIHINYIFYKYFMTFIKAFDNLYSYLLIVKLYFDITKYHMGNVILAKELFCSFQLPCLSSLQLLKNLSFLLIKIRCDFL